MPLVRQNKLAIYSISVFKEFERLASSRSVAGRLRGRLFFVEEVEAEVGFVFGAIDLERNFSACAMLVEKWIDRLQQN